MRGPAQTLLCRHNAQTLNPKKLNPNWSRGSSGLQEIHADQPAQRDLLLQALHGHLLPQLLVQRREAAEAGQRKVPAPCTKRKLFQGLGTLALIPKPFCTQLDFSSTLAGHTLALSSSPETPTTIGCRCKHGSAAHQADCWSRSPPSHTHKTGHCH